MAATLSLSVTHMVSSILGPDQPRGEALGSDSRGRQRLSSVPSLLHTGPWRRNPAFSENKEDQNEKAYMMQTTLPGEIVNYWNDYIPFP